MFVFAVTGIGLISLGFGFICFALMNIVAIRAETIDDYTSPYNVSAAMVFEEYRAAVVGIQAEQTGETPVANEGLYPVYPLQGDVIGSLSIPALELELPIIQGTGTDELDAGAGHFMQSVMPGEEDNCVISGHRDTIFARLGELEIGDRLIIETSAGTFTYEVTGTQIVEKDDRTVIVPTDNAVLTLTTCYPFRYVGPAPDRYIVSADLVTGE